MAKLRLSAKRRTDLTFVNCPQVLLDSALVMKRFFGPGRLESFFMDRRCDGCGKSSRLSVTAQTDISSVPSCSACGAAMGIDEDLEGYFDRHFDSGRRPERRSS